LTTMKHVLNDGHLIGNHTTTHRDITTVPIAQRVAELTETDKSIAPLVAWNRFLFRAPFGEWNPSVDTTLAGSPLKKYVGPVYWTMGGGPTTSTQAADWECWQLGMTTRACGDRYLTEIRALDHGIVLMHDRNDAADYSNHNLDAGVGNTID